VNREERIAGAVEAVPESVRAALEPVLRLLVHDLNGVLSAVTMEAFAVEQLSANVARLPRRGPTAEHDQLIRNLNEAVRNLRQAAAGGAAYLARVEALADEMVLTK